MDYERLEDERGVDLAQLRERIAMTPAERVDRLIHDVEVLEQIRRDAGVTPQVSFDPRAVCRALNDDGVRYVLVGGFAAALHGSVLPTTDVDIVPDRSGDNLERLANALRSIGARLRTSDGPVEAPLDAGFLDARPFMLNLTTDHGDVDLTFEPAGPRAGYPDWDGDAIDVPIADDLTVRVAALDAIIDSKRAADRDKDRMALPYLESLRDELRRQGG